MAVPTALKVAEIKIVDNTERAALAGIQAESYYKVVGLPRMWPSTRRCASVEVKDFETLVVQRKMWI